MLLCPEADKVIGPHVSTNPHLRSQTATPAAVRQLDDLEAGITAGVVLDPALDYVPKTAAQLAAVRKKREDMAVEREAAESPLFAEIPRPEEDEGRVRKVQKRE